MGGRVRKFSIYKHNDEKSLPQGHTCYNQLDLPAYKTKEKFFYQLIFIIINQMIDLIIYFENFIINLLN